MVASGRQAQFEDVAAVGAAARYPVDLVSAAVSSAVIRVPAGQRSGSSLRTSRTWPYGGGVQLATISATPSPGPVMSRSVTGRGGGFGDRPRDDAGRVAALAVRRPVGRHDPVAVLGPGAQASVGESGQ